ncbi:MAG: ECF transporter S component [Oscillospiraceae bacterium]|nr:ECF transporter S component [Oscillospiraceae bacterium]
MKKIVIARPDTNKIVLTAMLSAIACVVMLLVRINFMPAAPFLVYDPKDIIIAIGGFIIGPFAVIAMAIIVSLVEMLTVSADGVVGLIMNILSSCSFALPAAIIYKKVHTLKGAVIGLVAGWLFVTGVMVMWNYIITPIYRGFPREVIVPMLLPVFAPFNLIKYGLAAATTMLVYKPLSLALMKAGALEKTEAKTKAKQLIVGTAIAVGLAAIPCILLLLVLQGVI